MVSPCHGNAPIALGHAGADVENDLRTRPARCNIRRAAPFTDSQLISVATACVGDNRVHSLLPVQACTGLSRGSTVLESSLECRGDRDRTQVEVVPVWALFSDGAATAGFSG